MKSQIYSKRTGSATVHWYFYDNEPKILCLYFNVNWSLNPTTL